MKRFGWVTLPPNDGSENQVKSVAGVEHGSICFYKDTTTHYNCECGPPPAAFFSTPGNRDREMDAMAKKFPNMMFAPIEIGSAFKYPAAKEPARFVINEKGVLPQ